MKIKNSQLSHAVSALSALAQEHRLQVFRELVQAGNGGLRAGVIAERLCVPRSSLSFHLTHLKAAGLISEQRQGRSIIYTANYAEMRALIAYLLTNCCEGDTIDPQLIDQLDHSA